MILMYSAMLSLRSNRRWGLQDFAAANVVGRLGDLARDRGIGESAAELERVAEEAIAKEHRQFRAPFRDSGRLAAPFAGAVHDVVMNQRGEMDEFHHDGEVDMGRSRLACRLRGEQNKRGADALAAAFERVADVTRNAGIEFLHLKLQPLLDFVEIAADRAELGVKIELLGKSRKCAMNRFPGKITEGKRSGWLAHVAPR